MATATGGADRGPRFFRLIPEHTTIDFIGLRRRAVLVSIVLILVGLGSIAMRGGLNYGIDFSGGVMVHVRFPARVSVGEVRAALVGPELAGVVVQDVGQAGQEFQIRAAVGENEDGAKPAAAAKQALAAKFGEGAFEVLRVETVGPKVGRDLWRDATLAVLASTVLMGLYIAFRFDLRFGVGAAVALLHDVCVTVGAMSLANMEFDLTTVAGLLTVVGFSVNDTVIISDRIRENVRRHRTRGLAEIMNLSINETLSRTVITSGTAIMATLVLFLAGGSVIHSFAFTLLVGFVVGTYSSIFIAAPIVLRLQPRAGALEAKGAR